VTKLSPVVSSATRYHALDSLRASMMLLGIWFHASCSYVTLQTAWPYKDPDTSAFLNVPLLLIHVFRMPIFFALAGFFARFLWERAGTRSFLRNRVQRILVPFVVAWPILFVIVTLGDAYALSVTTHTPGRGMSAEYWSSGQWVTILRTMHLWFLYYLMFFYLLFLGMAALVRRYMSAESQDGIEATFRKLIRSPWRTLILALPTCIPLYFMRTATIETDSSFLISPKAFFAYAIFFGFGWLLFRQRDLLPDFRNRARTQVLLGLLISPLYFLIAQRALRVPPPEAFPLHAFAAFSGAIAIWLFLFGIIGLFIRFYDRPSAKARYLADASYWMYLIHLPLMIWIPLALRSFHLPAIVKFTIVLAISVPILLASYEWCVRYTFIGRALNGPRERKRDPEVVVAMKYKTAV
jgi:glucans biosynthesis protein C